MLSLRFLRQYSVNILRDFVDNSRNGAQETIGLNADWLQPAVQFCVTEEVFIEIHRGDSEVRPQLLSEANKYIPLESGIEEFERAQAYIRKLFGAANSVNNESDQRHLARAIASDCDAFVTRDGPVLEKADEIYAAHGLSVLRPSQLVAHVEELLNERDYQRDRLAGTELIIRRISGDAVLLSNAFLAGTESRRGLESRFNTFLAYPGRFNVKCVTKPDEGLLAVFVLDQETEPILDVALIRVSQKALETRLAGTLCRSVLAEVVSYAVNNSTKVVRISERILSPPMVSALQDHGFVQAMNSWVKFCLPVVGTRQQMLGWLKSVADAAGIQSEAIDRLVLAMSDSQFETNAASVLAIEHMLWPARISQTSVRNFIVPIRQKWAEDLFDSRLAKDRLWPTDTELALNPHSVYYRSKLNAPFREGDQGRILWYVSDDEMSGAKRIRACSQLTAVLTGKPKDLFRQFRRFGVYEWRHVLETAGSLDNSLMAMEFSDTELFETTLRFDEVSNILRKHGRQSTFPSPLEVNEPLFLEIYDLGVHRHPSREE